MSKLFISINERKVKGICKKKELKEQFKVLEDIANGHSSDFAEQP